MKEHKHEFTFKLSGFCIDKDGYTDYFTEKDVDSITWSKS